MFGGSSPSQLGMPPVQSFQYPNMDASAGNAFSNIGALGNVGGTGVGLGQQGAGIASGLAGSNAWMPGLMSALSAMGPAGGVANAGIGLGQGLLGGAGGLLSAIPQMLGQAFDPQGDLYKQTAASSNDQVMSNLAQSGLAKTPYGQSVAGNTANNFNINWQNNLLSRMLGGLGGAGQALGAVGGAGQMGEGLGSEGLRGAVGAGMAPFGVLSSVANTGLGALNSAIGGLGQSLGPLQQTIGDYLQYLQGGTGAMNAANQANLGAAQFAAQQQQQQYQNASSAFGGLGSMFGAMGPFGQFGAFGGGGGGGGLGSMLGGALLK